MRTKRNNWHVGGLTGSVPKVKQAIAAQADIPQHWRDCLCAEIDSACGTAYNFVQVHAHFSEEPEPTQTGHVSISIHPSKVLV